MSSHAFLHFRPTVGMALFLLLLAACAKEPAPAPVTIEGTEEVSATVEAIDVDTRMVVLRASDGTEFALLVPPEVRNLAQVKVGDRVVTRYRESLGAELVGAATARATPQRPLSLLRPRTRLTEQCRARRRARKPARPCASRMWTRRTTS